MARCFVPRESWGEQPRGHDKGNGAIGVRTGKKTLDQASKRQRYQGDEVSDVSDLPLDGNFVERHHDQMPKRRGGTHTIKETVAQHVAGHIVEGRRIEDKSRGKKRKGKPSNPDFDLIGRLNQLDDEDILVVSSIVSNKTGTNVRFF